MNADRQAHGQAAWRAMAGQRGPMARLLWSLSRVLAALVGLRHRCYQWGWLRAERLPVPVVVVGNLVAGGAGKTPTVLSLVAHLQARGWRPGVISRGHGGRADAPLPVEPDTPAALCGDEPLQIRRAAGVPVCVARRRADAGRALLARHPEVNIIVCDDGLQHRALHADLRIAVFDDRGTGNGWLLPAGLLREPWPPGPAQPVPDLVLQHTRHGQRTPDLPAPAATPVFRATRRLHDDAVDAQGQRRRLDSWRGQPVNALAGVARPEVFFDMLRERGLRLAAALALPDHADASRIGAALAGLSGPVFCTEKDLVKLGDHTGASEVWAVPLVLDVEPAFFEALDERLQRA